MNQAANDMSRDEFPALISIVVPVFNEDECLPEFYGALARVLRDLEYRWEVLFVDDGSTDGTLPLLRDLARRDGRVRAISLSRNFGKERAVAAGLRYARGDAAILIDADLQHPPRVMRDFIDRWREGYDIVYGQRVSGNGGGKIYRKISAGFYRLFRAISHVPLPDGSGDFRLLSRVAIDSMNRLTEGERYNNGLYAWIGFRSIGVPYRVGERANGSAKWRFLTLAKFALDAVTSFSTVPLRIWSYLGFVISLLAVAYSAYFAIRTLLWGPDVPGFPSLIVSITFFSGIQLISLGVMGEYLGRLYEESKRRPLYLVAEEIGSRQAETGIPNSKAVPAAAPEEIEYPGSGMGPCSTIGWSPSVPMTLESPRV